MSIKNVMRWKLKQNQKTKKNLEQGYIQDTTKHACPRPRL